MLSRKLLLLTGFLGLTLTTLAGIKSVSALGLGRQDRFAVVTDGPRDPALERLLRRHRARAIDQHHLGR
jgi:hypothetical protein